MTFRKKQVDGLIKALGMDMIGLGTGPAVIKKIAQFSLFKSAGDEEDQALVAKRSLQQAYKIVVAVGRQHHDDEKRWKQAISDMEELLKYVDKRDFDSAKAKIDYMLDDDKNGYISGRYFTGDDDSKEVDLDGSVLDGTYWHLQYGPNTQKWIGYMKVAQGAVNNLLSQSSGTEDLKLKLDQVLQDLTNWAKTLEDTAAKAAAKDINKLPDWKQYLRTKIAVQKGAVLPDSEIEAATSKGRAAFDSIKAQYSKS